LGSKDTQTEKRSRPWQRKKSRQTNRQQTDRKTEIPEETANLNVNAALFGVVGAGTSRAAAGLAVAVVVGHLTTGSGDAGGEGGVALVVEMTTPFEASDFGFTT
jgi:hypothetical protein